MTPIQNLEAAWSQLDATMKRRKFYHGPGTPATDGSVTDGPTVTDGGLAVTDH